MNVQEFDKLQKKHKEIQDVARGMVIRFNEEEFRFFVSELARHGHDYSCVDGECLFCGLKHEC